MSFLARASRNFRVTRPLSGSENMASTSHALHRIADPTLVLAGYLVDCGFGTIHDLQIIRVQILVRYLGLA